MHIMGIAKDKFIVYCHRNKTTSDIWVQPPFKCLVCYICYIPFLWYKVNEPAMHLMASGICLSITVAVDSRVLNCKDLSDTGTAPVALKRKDKSHVPVFWSTLFKTEFILLTLLLGGWNRYGGSTSLAKSVTTTSTATKNSKFCFCISLYLESVPGPFHVTSRVP